MWSACVEQLDGGKVQRYLLEQQSARLTVRNVVALWQHNREFCEFFNRTLAAAPYGAFRWETPALTAATMDSPFEFVVVESPGLISRADAEPFQRHFSGIDHGVVSFPNLSGDAVLIVPTPQATPDTYAHLASFLRQAPEAQRLSLWPVVAESLMRRIGDKAVWLSTAGAGVAWLHVRLDDTPKYYHYRPYREPKYYQSAHIG